MNKKKIKLFILLILLVAFGLAIMLIISQEDLLSFFFFFLLSAFDVVIDIILAINDIIVWLEQAAKVVEGLVKLVPVVMLVIYAVLVAYYCSHKK